MLWVFVDCTRRARCIEGDAPAANSAMSCCTFFNGLPRAMAMQAAWVSAEAGLMTGSNLLPEEGRTIPGSVDGS